MLPPWGEDDQEHPGVQGLVEVFSALFEAGPRLEFTGSRLEAQAKERLFPDDESQSFLRLFLQRGLMGRESSSRPTRFKVEEDHFLTRVEGAFWDLLHTMGRA